MRGTEDEIKDNLLRFASSELTSHASNLLGISILLFTYLNVTIQSQYFPKIQFPLAESAFNLKTVFDYSVIFLIFWVLNTGVFFTVVRLVYYGKYANTIIRYEKPINSLKELHEEVCNRVRNEKFLGVSLGSFSSGVSELSKGFWYSFVIGFILSIVVFSVFFFS